MSDRVLVLALVLGACGLFKEPKYPPVQVEIVSMPKTDGPRVGWACMLEPKPKPPEEQKVNYEDEDALRRVWVHVRAYNEMVQYAHDLDFWATSITTCVTELAKQHLRM